MSTALAVFAATLAAVITLRKKVPEWAAAACGAFATVAFGIETPLQAIHAVESQWNVILFFLGLAALISIADVCGVFRTLALRAAAAAGGSAKRLFYGMMGLTVLITAALTNDAAVLVLVPLVAELAGALTLPPVPFAIGIALMANASSALLPISNPSNFIVADAMRWNLPEYAAAIAAPALAALLAAWFVVPRYFAAALQLPYRIERPAGTLYVPAVLLLTATATAMVGASLVRFPVGLVCASFALAGIVLLGVRHPRSARAIFGKTNFGLAVLAAGLFVVVDGLRVSGAIDALVALAAPAFAYGHGAAPVAAMTATAVAANAFNNLPAAMLAAQIATYHALAAAPAHDLAAGAVVGLAIGPNFTTIGSLSTMLVLIELRRRGFALRSRDFLLPGALVTLAGLGAGALAFGVLAALPKP